MRSPASGTGDRTGDQLMTRVTGIIRDVHPERFHPRAQVGLGGDIPNAIAEREALKDEAIKTSGLAVLLILGAIVVFFRSFSALAHIGVAMLTGVGLAFSVAYFAFGYLNASTAFLGSIIAGNGINYGIIYLARYRDRRALGDSVEAALVDAAVVSRRGTQLAALAAAFAYGTLMLTSFRGFSQFGLIGGVGMIFCWCATMIVVPATVTAVEALRAKLLPRRAARVASGPTRTPITGAIAWLTGRYPKHVLAVGAVLCVWAAVALPKFLADPWEYNFARLGSRGSRHSGADSWSNRAGRIFVGRSSSPDILLADRFEDVIELSSALMQRDQQRTGGRYIDHIETAWDRLGGQPAAMARKLEILQTIRADIDAILPELSGDDLALAREWRPPEGLRAPQPDELPALVRAQFTEKSGRFGTPIFVYYKPWFTPSDGRKLMIVAELTQNVRLADGRTVPTVSRSTVFAEMVRAMSSDGPRATFAAFLVVVFHSLLATRRLGPAAMVLCSLLAGVLLTVGGAAHLDVRLNFLNFVALPLTFGIGVEYAMNLYDRVEHLGDVGDGLRSVGGAVSLCSLTTIIGYGSLLVADNQALQSFGYLAVAGELACSGTAMFLLPSAMVPPARANGACGVSSDDAIPRILHQTWKTRDVPARFREYVASWLAHNPGWEHRVWSDDDNDEFIRTHYPAFLPTFRAYRTGIERADAVRYFLLHKYGGLYVDLDFECLRPIEPVLAGATCVLGCEPRLHAERLHHRPRLLCNALMASAPGHPFWLRVHDELLRRATRSDGSDPVESTGPKVVDAAYEAWSGEDIRLVDPEVFYPVPDIDSVSLGLTPKERSYYANMVRHRAYWNDAVAVHHWSHTWIATHDVRARSLAALRSLSRVGLALRGRITADEILRHERYGVEFTESAFEPRPSRAAAWRADLARARSVASELRIGFCVLLHDRVDLVPLLRKRIEHLGAAFAGWKLILYGADSSDGTAAAVARWAAEDPRVVLPEFTESAARGIGRIAALRNHLLDAVEREAVDVVAMLDGDLAGPVSRDGLGMRPASSAARPRRSPSRRTASTTTSASTTRSRSRARPTTTPSRSASGTGADAVTSMSGDGSSACVGPTRRSRSTARSAAARSTTPPRSPACATTRAATTAST